MTFTFKDENGEEVQDIRKCEDCGFLQTRKHFGEDGSCPMCQTGTCGTLM